MFGGRTLDLHNQWTAGSLQGRELIKGVKLHSALSVPVGKGAGLYHDIGGFHPPFSEVRMLTQNGDIASQTGIDDKKFDEKGSDFSGFRTFSGEGMPPAHIPLFGQRTS